MGDCWVIGPRCRGFPVRALDWGSSCSTAWFSEVPVGGLLTCSLAVGCFPTAGCVMALSDRQIALRGGWDHCPRAEGLRVWSLAADGVPSGRPRAASCGSNRCPFCVVTNIWKTSLAVSHAAPSRYAVLTGVSTDDWQVNRRALARLWQGLERDEVRAGRRELLLRAWYCFEVNPRETGWHLNLWWWGPDVPQTRLSELSEAVGWGPVVHVQRWSAASVGYGMKEATNYGLKELDSSTEHGRRSTLTDAQSEYLLRNGGRLMGSRRGRACPWRDGVKGPALSGQRETLAAYWARRGGVAGSSVVTDSRGHIAFSRDVESPVAEPIPTFEGKWVRSAPGRSDWAWGGWADETLELFSATS